MFEMVNVSICVGSACHMKGSKEVIAKLKELVKANQLEGQVLLNGSFCTGNCQYAVCVVIDDTVYSVRPETIEEFFNNEILSRVS
jgi:NADH:ubiquinone oxidoreductase subunit E